jgi:hypothetical protein
MKYSLRSLMIGVLVLPPLLALAWFAYQQAAPSDESWDALDYLNTFRTGYP